MKILIIDNHTTNEFRVDLALKKLGYENMLIQLKPGDVLSSLNFFTPDLIFIYPTCISDLANSIAFEKIRELQVPAFIIGEGERDEVLKGYTFLQYIKKPEDDEILYLLLETIMSVLKYSVQTHQDNSTNGNITSACTNHLFLKKRGEFHKIAFDKITTIQSNDNYCSIKTVDNTRYTIRCSMKKIEEILPSHLFCRVHRKHIVQVNLISSINYSKGELQIGAETFSISASRIQSLKLKTLHIA